MSERAVRARQRGGRAGAPGRGGDDVPWTDVGIIAISVAVGVLVAVVAVPAARPWWWLVGIAGLAAAGVAVLAGTGMRAAEVRRHGPARAGRKRGGTGAGTGHDGRIPQGTDAATVGEPPGSDSGGAVGTTGAGTIPAGPAPQGALEDDSATVISVVPRIGEHEEASASRPAGRTAGGALVGPPPAVTGDRLTFEALSVPKGVHSAGENEDAWAADVDLGRVAVADGASSAYMAREWSYALTAAFVADPTPTGATALRRWLDRVTADWRAGQPGDTGEWWVDASRSRGSHATLAGLAVEGDGSWTMVAVGDSCVMHLATDGDGGPRLLTSFPLDRPDAFDRHPDLLSTTGGGESPTLPVVRTAHGAWRRGDVFLAMTDALARWTLAADAAGSPEWGRLLTVDGDRFARLVAQARRAGQLEDDDTTMVRVRPAVTSESGSEASRSVAPVDGVAPGGLR